MSIIIKKLTITPKKTTLVYIDHPHDPVDKTVVYDDGYLPTIPLSHADAIAAWVIEEKTAPYHEELKQLPFAFNDDDPETSEEDIEGNNVEEGEEPEEDGGMDATFPEPGEVSFYTDSEGCDMVRNAEGVVMTEALYWSSFKVPVHPETVIPDFRAMEKRHACWYVRTAYVEDDELFDAKEALANLKADMKYNGFKGVESRKSLPEAKARAVEIIMGQ